MSGSEKFPWQSIMHFGLGILCLPPKHFWGATLTELSASANAFSTLTGTMIPLDQNRLSELMHRFPDQPFEQDSKPHD